MKVDIETIKDTFKIGFEVYEGSYKASQEIVDLFHNRHYTSSQEAALDNRGQPKETFNVIRMFTRMITGYFDEVVTNITTKPIQQNDVVRAATASDTIQSCLRSNNWNRLKNKLAEDIVVPGLVGVYYNVIDTGKKDAFGQPVYKIVLEQVPWKQIVKDPLSTQDDYSDARFVHRWKWVSEESMVELFGAEKVKELEEYHNETEQPLAEFEETFNVRFNGKYKYHNNYLLVHSIVKDDKGQMWSVYWSDEKILRKKKLVYKYLQFPYRVIQTITSDKSEFQSIFNDVKESQKAIDQAILQIQQLANTNKVIVEANAVEDMEKLATEINRVNAIIEIKDITKIKLENLSGDVITQYGLINNALDRIQRVLGINDSFLGVAKASDSGRS